MGVEASIIGNSTKNLRSLQSCHKHYTELVIRVLYYANKMQSQVRASDCDIHNTELFTAQCFHKNTIQICAM
jgi:hypothetical protein